MSEPVSGLVSRAELVRLRSEVRVGGKQPQLDLPPGEDEPDDHVVIYITQAHTHARTQTHATRKVYNLSIENIIEKIIRESHSQTIFN